MNKFKILFFLSHQPNPRFVKQINYLSRNDFDVTLYCFKRKTLADLNSSINEEVKIYDLGMIPNFSNPIKRISKYIYTVKKLKSIVKKKTYDFVILNNIDILLLYLFSKSKSNTEIIIEISDLREYVFKNNLQSRFLRYLEEKLYKNYVDKLIVTSKKYYSYHYSGFFDGDVFVLENKLLSKELKLQDNNTKTASKKIRIGIVGLLLRKNEYVKLFETYKDNLNVEIHIHGTGEFEKLIEKYSEDYENIIYHGKYNAFLDTQRIYNSIDIIYLVYESNDKNKNNILALPNKLYESIFYKVPILCSKGTYLGEIVDKYKIGCQIDYLKDREIEEAVNKIKNNRNSFITNINRVPNEVFLADEDYKKLKKFLIKDETDNTRP